MQTEYEKGILDFHLGKPCLQCLKHSKKMIGFLDPRSTDSSVVLWGIQQRRIPENDIFPTLKEVFAVKGGGLAIGNMDSCRS